MKIHIDAEASHPIGWARIRGTGSVGTQSNKPSATISRVSRPAKWKKSTASTTASTDTRHRCTAEDARAAAHPSRKHHTIVSGR
jgi:hypothetical protein